VCSSDLWFTGGQVPAHTIRNNRFSRPDTHLDDQGNLRNGQETIRIGDSGASMWESSCLVTGNLFHQCDGEGEIISSKSCKNTYRGNLFRSSAGTLTLRHGNNCLVENNLFLGEGVALSGGVRIIGEGHTVRGNYFENLRGSGYRTAICIVRGQSDSPLSGYYQVKNATVTQNIIVNCTNGLNVNYGTSEMTIPVISTTVSNNVICNTTASNVAIGLVVTTPAAAVTWTGNTVWGGKYTGGMTSATIPMATVQPAIASRQALATQIEAASGVTWQITN
jgi:poly(beta-D-mannuronate) lyase